MRHILYLVHLCPCPCQFMSYLYDLRFIFNLISIIPVFVFCTFFLECLPLFLNENMDEENEKF